MKSVAGFNYFLALGLSLSLQTQAAERFSIEEWKESFAKAANSGKPSEIEKLIDFKKLESKAIPKCTDCSNKKKMSEARALFAKGDFAGAEKLYNQIPKGSDQWLEAVEERGWAHFQRDNYEKALAQTKTLLSPQFQGAVNTEAFFLQSLSQLRICDYEGILTTHKTFKDKHRNRIVEIQNLSTSGVNEALRAVIKQAEKFPLKFEEMGDNVTKLPLLFYRDIEFQKLLLKIKVAQAAISVIPDTSPLKSRYIALSDESTTKLINRVKVLADRENTENSRMIQKLNLIEVEAIQRIHTDMKLGSDSYKGGKFKKVSDDQLIFMDDGQPWIDELDKFDVAAKACAKGIRRKM